jgi:hypothetical protein
MKRTFVEYSLPGAFFSEYVVREVTGRNDKQVIAEAPKGAFAFQFFDRVFTTSTQDGDEVALSSGRINVGPTSYIGGEVMDAEAVAALPGDHRTLLSNMRGNDWPFVIRCRTGNFQPFDPAKDRHWPVKS